MRGRFRMFLRVTELFDMVRGYWTWIPWPVRWALWLGLTKMLPSFIITLLLQAADLIAENPVVTIIVFAASVTLLLTVFRAFPIRIPYPLGEGPKESRTERHGVQLAALLRWHDNVGRPIVHVDKGRIVSVWAALDVEVRNLSSQVLRLSDLFLEIYATGFPKSLIAVATPAAIDADDRWYQRANPQRVEWELPPASAVITHHVRFIREFGFDNPSAPIDPIQFDAAIVADLGTERRRIRLRLGDDIMTERKQ